jgi:glycosyltransferase involved in cell wall biosynthesis
MRIDLLHIGSVAELPAWNLGSTAWCPPSAKSLAAWLRTWLEHTTADALLLWDPRLGDPDATRLEQLLHNRGDVWHAGLSLGMQGQPGLLDFVHPNWMLNCDALADREVTSWRVPAGATLVRTAVLRQLGVPSDDFETSAGALLEWGHRAIVRGALMRHVPDLVGPRGVDAHNWAAENTPSLEDELRFVAYRHGRLWARWTIARAVMSGYASMPQLVRAWSKIPQRRPYDEPAPYRPERSFGEPDLAAARVTVLIPTLNRYKYLRVILGNLREQTVRPHEIIIIDQSPKEKRDLALGTDFADLPLRLMYQDEPGQCASRNAGLAVSTGDFVLFIDDDDELTPTLIEEHLRNLARFDADVSSGVATEVGTAPLAADKRFVRSSDVFPTNNTLARRDVLKRSGLFDLAFNRAPRADGELGMRVYKSGAFMVLDQGLAVMHHRALEGGLRAHGARVITYRTSRETLMQRHLPHISEIYLVTRHFSPRQRREMLWLRAFGTLSGKGSTTQRLAKILVGGLMLPDTVKTTIERERAAREWMTRFPQIAELDR